MTDTWLRRILALALLAATACGGGRSEPTRVAGGGMTLEARVAPANLRVGVNELQLELRDEQGRLADDADVSVRVYMHAMGAMPAMGGAAHVEDAGEGRWRAHFALEMGGTWRVEIRAQRPGGETLRAEGSLTIGTPGLRLAAAGGAPAEPAPAMEGAESAAPEGEAGAGHVHGSAPRPSGRSEGAPGEFQLDESRLRQLGIGSEPARREELTAKVRAFGRVVLDETTLRDVTVRVGGFVGEVEADALGARVERGQVLFTFYSPEVYAAQQEYLEALRSQSAARGTSAPGRSDALARAAARRLELWGFAAGEIAAIARRGTPQEYLPVRAPVAGYVVEKEVVAGSPVESGQRVYRIAPLDRVWIDAEIYEAELALVAPGQPAEVELPYAPGRRFEATVAYVYPRLQEDRRTARVRLELANPELVLRPGMYADVFLRRALGPRLTVPESAVLRAGERSFVFLDLGQGRLRPQRVETGIESEGRVEILSGLEEGARIVSSGTFLVAGESRLRAALDSW
ncbi:MAG TPA: efflux RND transporter periplasmic adaptor subunit [Myxococcota bacterium]|nr:efflux RND transporter periplasmic adaptor subunit [Myxococcota bacterium]